MGSLRATLVAFALAASASAQSVSFSHLAGSAGGASSEDGPTAAARFNYPSSVAVDRTGNVYVADTTNHLIRKISGGAVATLAGLWDQWGNRDGVGGVARFNQPGAVAVDAEGTVYVADSINGRIRRISASGRVTTLSPPVGIVYAVAVDDEGSVYVARDAIQKITPAGQLITIAGVPGSSGSEDGSGSAARFNEVMGLAVDAAGNIYAADSGNHVIRRITPAGVVTTVAGLAGASGSSDGGSAARFKGPFGVAVDRAGNLFVADTFNRTIRKIDPAGMVTTLAGKAGEDGIADGAGSTARFSVPLGVAVGEDGTVYVADTFNHTMRTITPGGVVDTIAGRPNEPGSNDGSGSTARFFWPYDVAVDAAGIVYAADTFNHTIRRITPDGVVTTLAGLAGVMGSSDGKGATARFAFPKGIAVDVAGNIYVSDTGNHTIRTVSPDGTVGTLAGEAGFSGSVDGFGSDARFSLPTGLTVDRNGAIYIADTGNHTIRLISPGGEVTTLAGLAGVAGSDDGVSGATARFNSPQDVALALPDPSDLHLLVADTGNHTLRLVRNGGWVDTYSGLAGSPGTTSGGTPRSARWSSPTSIAIIYLDRFYVTDTGNQLIRVISGFTSGGFVAGSPNAIGSSDGGGFDARFNNPGGIAVDSAGNVYVADVSNHAIRKGSPGGDAARIDKSTGPEGTVRQLGTFPQNATSWKWELVRRPVGSTAELSSATSANPLFVPDVGDIFVFRLTARNATGTSVTHVRLTATPLPRRRAVGHGE